nr:hypothetical protein [uncultured Caproiciproducens sp.]
MSEIFTLLKDINQNLNAVVINQAMIYNQLLQLNRAESHRRTHNRHCPSSYRRKHAVRQHQQNNSKQFPQHHTDQAG